MDTVAVGDSFDNSNSVAVNILIIRHYSTNLTGFRAFPGDRKFPETDFNNMFNWCHSIKLYITYGWGNLYILYILIMGYLQWFETWYLIGVYVPFCYQQDAIQIKFGKSCHFICIVLIHNSYLMTLDMSTLMTKLVWNYAIWSQW